MGYSNPGDVAEKGLQLDDNLQFFSMYPALYRPLSTSVLAKTL